MQTLPAALAPLSAFPQFVLYKLKREGEKTQKLPVDHRTGLMPKKGTGGAHNRDIWTDAQTALAALAQGRGDGLGFVFTAEDPFWFLDLDYCLVDGDWSPAAKQLMQAFSGAAVEISQSGQGLHIIGSGKCPPHGCDNEAINTQFYTEKRFVALTGTHISGNAGTDHTVSLAWLVQHYFPIPKAGQHFGDWDDAITLGPCPEWRGQTDDADLLRRALKSQGLRSTFGDAASFADLWTANHDALSRAFPDEGRPYNESKADRALAQHLAFWTGKDCARIERLMRQSSLVREKWEREDYLPRTILSAVSEATSVLTDAEPEAAAGPAAAVDSPRPKHVEGDTFFNAEAQINLFSGCVLVVKENRALVPGGFMLRPDQFRTNFGGYQFGIDKTNEKTTKNAWEAFTESQALRPPRADGTCFRPDRSPAEIIHHSGLALVNTWWPVGVARKVGDARPFLNHLERLLPDERDRTIFLSYMAGCVQYQGVKFQWAPVVQGVEGNGKTMFTLCVMEAIGQRYTHMPPASEIHEKYNSWLFGTIFVGVEDIYVPDQKREVFEILKPMITGQYLAKRAMHTDQVMHNVVCNFIFNSNHKDALRKSRNDRRLAILYCAQQVEEHLKRDGLDGTYMRDLYHWLRHEDGFAIVAELLHTWPIPPEFNPAGACGRAPVTTSTEEAITVSMGAVEHEVIEAIEQGTPGFAGGWVSSMALDTLIDRFGKRSVPRSKRRELLMSLGYDWHPGLTNGRVNNNVEPDMGKPRLFIKRGHPHLSLTGAAEIAHAYTQAQKVFDHSVN